MSSTNLITLFVPASLPQLWKDGHKAFVFRVISRSLQCILAFIITILYAIELSHFSTANIRAPAAWIYAEMVAGLSLVTCALHYFYTLENVWWTVQDFILCILWTAQSGFFGTLYLGDKGAPVEYEKETELGTMKAGAVIGLACLVLWLATFVQGIVWRCKMQSKKRMDRKRVDGITGTLEPQYKVGREMVARHRMALSRRESSLGSEVLPTYKQATTTEQALAKQREALGEYDEEAFVGGQQDTTGRPAGPA